MVAKPRRAACWDIKTAESARAENTAGGVTAAYALSVACALILRKPVLPSFSWDAISPVIDNTGLLGEGIRDGDGPQRGHVCQQFVA